MSYLNRPVLVYNGLFNSTVMQCTSDVLTYVENDPSTMLADAAYGI